MIRPLIHAHDSHRGLLPKTASSTASRIQPQSAVDHFFRITVRMTKDHDLGTAKLPCHIFFVVCHKKFHTFYSETKCLCNPLSPVSVIISSYDIDGTKATDPVKKFRSVHITCMQNAVTCLEDFQDFRS